MDVRSVRKNMLPTLHAYYKPRISPRTNEQARVCHFLQIRDVIEGIGRGECGEECVVTIRIPRSRPVKIYINIHFYDEYTKGDVYLFAKIPKTSSEGEDRFRRNVSYQRKLVNEI